MELLWVEFGLDWNRSKYAAGDRADGCNGKNNLQDKYTSRPFALPIICHGCSSLPNRYFNQTSAVMASRARSPQTIDWAGCTDLSGVVRLWCCAIKTRKAPVAAARDLSCCLS
jgi:hypothetical protein